MLPEGRILPDNPVLARTGQVTGAPHVRLASPAPCATGRGGPEPAGPPARPGPARGYGSRGGRCTILRSGSITMRKAPPAGRGERLRSFVTSDGMGGTDGSGGTGGPGGAVPLGDGRGRVVAGPGSG